MDNVVQQGVTQWKTLGLSINPESPLITWG